MVESLIGKATVLAVGTELTTGQVINRNAAWISEKLIPRGVDVVFHLTVPDDRPLILQGLDLCRKASQLIFVTGGLGPTTDDFTREVVSEWLNRPLEYQPHIWQEIAERLTQLGVPVAESNRQQCFFPQGAQILANPRGTAAGFSCPLTEGEGQIWVLPGPPHEIAAIWDECRLQIEAGIRVRAPALIPIRLMTWQCMGKSEAELGEITEKALLGSQLKTGYRAHRPFVEIKVWCEESQLAQKAKWIAELEQAIQPWLMAVHGEDLAIRLLKLLQPYQKIAFFDRGTGSLLAQRLDEALRKAKYVRPPSHSMTFQTAWNSHGNPSEDWVLQTLESCGGSNNDTLHLALGGFTQTGVGSVGLGFGAKRFKKSIQFPYSSSGATATPETVERTQKYAVEMALKIWTEILGTLPNGFDTAR